MKYLPHTHLQSLQTNDGGTVTEHTASRVAADPAAVGTLICKSNLREDQFVDLAKLQGLPLTEPLE